MLLSINTRLLYSRLKRVSPRSSVMVVIAFVGFILQLCKVWMTDASVDVVAGKVITDYIQNVVTDDDKLKQSFGDYQASKLLLGDSSAAAKTKFILNKVVSKAYDFVSVDKLSSGYTFKRFDYLSKQPQYESFSDDILMFKDGKIALDFDVSQYPDLNDQLTINPKPLEPMIDPLKKDIPTGDPIPLSKQDSVKVSAMSEVKLNIDSKSIINFGESPIDSKASNLPTQGSETIDEFNNRKGSKYPVLEFLNTKGRN